MARVNQSVIGKLSGKLGDLVFRQVNGKSFVSVRPKKYNPTKSEKAKSVRSGFREINLFASTINKNETLKYLWSFSKIKARSSYTKILKSNLEKTPKTGICELNIITPENGFDINGSIFIQNSTIQILFSTESIIFNLHEDLKCFVLIFSKDCRKDSFDPFSANLLNNHSFDIQNNNVQFSFNFELSKKYKTHYLFVSLVAINANKIVSFSKTSSKTIIIRD